MAAAATDFLKDIKVRELLDLSPKIRRYLVGVIPDISSRGGETLEAVASEKCLALDKLLRGIHRELQRAATDELETNCSDQAGTKS